MRKTFLILLLNALILLLNTGLAVCMGVPTGGGGGNPIQDGLTPLILIFSTVFWLLGLYISMKIIASVWFNAKLKYEIACSQRLLRRTRNDEE